MGDYGKCNICGKDLVFCESKDVGGTSYNVLECKKCKRKIVRGS